MTWTYTNAPGNSTTQARIDAVRVFVGDIDTNDQKVTDEVIEFALDQTSNHLYNSAAIVARTIAAQYSALAETSFDEVSVKYHDVSKQFYVLASKLEKQGKLYGGFVPVIYAGGISNADIDTVHSDTDRPGAYFRRRQFANEFDQEDDESGFFDS